MKSNLSFAFSVILPVLLILIVPIDSYSLKPLQFTQTQLSALTPKSLGIKIAESQTELLQKPVLHFLEAEIRRMQQSQNKEQINGFLNSWFKTENIDATMQMIENHMRNKLSQKLGMETLTDSFKREIEAHPQEYFLTFDMYDLLIDE